MISEQKLLIIRAVFSSGDWNSLLESTISTNNAPTQAVIPFSYVNSDSVDGTKSYLVIFVGELKIDTTVSFDFLKSYIILYHLFRYLLYVDL